jgi:hypothetical protein
MVTSGASATSFLLGSGQSTVWEVESMSLVEYLDRRALILRRVNVQARDERRA